MTALTSQEKTKDKLSQLDMAITVVATPGPTKLDAIKKNIRSGKFFNRLNNNLKQYDVGKVKIVNVQEAKGKTVQDVCSDAKCLKKANTPEDDHTTMWIIVAVVAALVCIGVIYAFFACGDQGRTVVDGREYKRYGDTGSYMAPQKARRGSDVASEMAYNPDTKGPKVVM